MITIITIVIVAIVVAVIAYIIGSVNNNPSLPRCCLTCLHEHRHGIYPPFVDTGVCCNHFGFTDIKKRLSDLEVNQRVIDKQFNEIKYNMKMGVNPILYAKSIPEQEIIDSLTKGLKPLNELVNKLGK